MFLLIIVATAVLAALLGLVQRPTDRSVAAFAKVYDVELTSTNVPMLRGYIWWSRCWRVGGAVVAVTAVAVFTLIVDGRAAVRWEALIVGYAVGAIIGEALRPRPRGPQAAASLERRGVTSHLSRPFLLLSSTAIVSALVACTAYVLLASNRSGWFMYAPGSTEPIGPDSIPARWVAISAAVMAVAAVAVAWLIAGSIARAAAPADDQQSTHHAIRSAAIVSLGGAATMAVGSIGSRFGFEAMLLDGDETVTVQWLVNLAACWCFLAILWGGVMTLTAIPRSAPFGGSLPTVPS